MYKNGDFSRKLNPGMILQAQRERDLDLENSILNALVDALTVLNNVQLKR
jgi:hypothetical protein